MTDSDKEVLYAWERDRIFSEDYKGTFDSIKECIEDAKSEGFKHGQMIYIGKCIEPDISCGVWFDRVLEDVQDAMYSDYGDNAEDWDLSVGDIEERQVNLIKRKKVKNMKEKDKELMKEAVDNIKKLDQESLMLVNASINILIARQKMDENKPTTAA